MGKNFGEFIERNLKWYEMRNSRTLDNEAIANFTRNTLAQAIRRNPYVTFVIQAGWDEEKGPSLYWMDYFGSLAKPNATAQGLDLVRMCIDQLSTRYVIKLQSFIVKIVDKDGVRQIDLKKKVTLDQKKPIKDAPPTVTGIPQYQE